MNWVLNSVSGLRLNNTSKVYNFDVDITQRVRRRSLRRTPGSCSFFHPAASKSKAGNGLELGAVLLHQDMFLSRNE
jgi:hypothetical protein